MSATKTVAVAGAGATNVVATVAVNLAVAFAVLGARVQLRDVEPGRSATRALTGASLDRTTGSVCRVTSRPGAPLAIPAAEPVDESRADDQAHGVTVVSCASEDAAGDAIPETADVVLVAVDGTPQSLLALDAVASRCGGRTVTILLSRSISRRVDRWALVDRLSERADARLSPHTVPMGGGSRAGRGAASRPATLYAPTTAAARAYAAVATELVAALAITLEHPNGR